MRFKYRCGAKNSEQERSGRCEGLNTVWLGQVLSLWRLKFVEELVFLVNNNSNDYLGCL